MRRRVWLPEEHCSGLTSRTWSGRNSAGVKHMWQLTEFQLRSLVRKSEAMMWRRGGGVQSSTYIQVSSSRSGWNLLVGDDGMMLEMMGWAVAPDVALLVRHGNRFHGTGDFLLSSPVITTLVVHQINTLTRFHLHVPCVCIIPVFLTDRRDAWQTFMGHSGSMWLWLVHFCGSATPSPALTAF